MMKSAPSSLASVDDELREARDLDVVEVRHRLGQHILALLEGEHALALLRVAHGRHDHLVEEPRRDLDQLEVAVVDGSNDPG